MSVSVKNDLELIKALHLLNRVHVGEGIDQSIDIIKNYVENSGGFRGQVKVHEYASGEEYNHWIVPPKWVVKKCELKNSKGEVIISGDEHPLVLTPYSASFTGKISKEDLLSHIHYREDLPEAIPYIFRRQYRHWERDWGIAIPYKLAQTLTEDEYEVDIQTSFEEGTMKLFEYTVQGESDQAIVFCGHLDHPGQVNDSVSGCVSSLEVVKNLEVRHEKLQYTYKVIICIEISGSAIYLDQNPELAQNMIYAFCPNMLGHDAPLALCLSKHGDTPLDRAMLYVLSNGGYNHVVGKFHKYPDCGDEISFDAPGLDISTTTLSRIGEQFKYYHTSLDTPERLDADKFHEAVDVMTRALSVLERDYIPLRTYVGNPCLSNPKLNLYLEPRNISNLYNAASEVDGLVNTRKPDQPVDPRLFMEFFISNLEGRASIMEIADAFSVPFEFVLAYADEFIKHGLLEKKPLAKEKAASLGDKFVGVSMEDTGVLF